MAPKSIPAAWVNEQNQFLQNKLPKNVQGSIFTPDSHFYEQYNQNANKTEGLHYMARVLFDWLKIEPRSCVIDFYEEKDFPAHAGETAGFYTKFESGDGQEKELIFINAKHRNNALAVGAILAHEMMHLYLFRFGLKLEDTQENELLTDLATINTGLSVLILNGMHYQTYWWLTIILIFFRIFYRRTDQLSFGYFKPREYGEHVLVHLQSKNMGASDVIGYINPSSRHFLPHRPFLRGKATTEFIKKSERKYWIATIIKYIPATILVGLLALSVIQDGQQSTTNAQLQSRIENCKSEVGLLERIYKADEARLRSMKEQIDAYTATGNIAAHDDLVDPFNALLEQTRGEYDSYSAEFDNCQSLINTYNSSM